MRHGLNDLARTIIDSNRYMVVATADRAGHPWVTPVWFATKDYMRFHWVSSPAARHSRNVAARPEVAITIFDSTVPVGEGQAVYMAGTAEELTGPSSAAASRISGGSPRPRSVVCGCWTTCSRRPSSASIGRPSRSNYVLIAGRDPELGTGVDRRERVTPA